jgi:LEA14-like dessication related protein
VVAKNRLYLAVAIIGVIIVSTVVASYLWQQSQIIALQQAEQELHAEQKQSVEGISVELTKFTLQKTSFSFSADIEVKIHNTASLDVSLEDATITLYVNNINIQTKGFQQEVLKINAYYYNIYTTTMVTFDTETINALKELTSYNTHLDLSANAKCGDYTSAISVTHQGSWQSTSPLSTPTPTATPSPTGTSTPVPTPTPSPTPAVGYSRFNPAPINTNLDVTFQWISGNYKARIALLEVIRGNEAWQLIEAANIFNDPPEIGTEYLLARIRFEYVEGPSSDTTYTLSDYSFDVISETGVEYDLPFIVAPEPDLGATLYIGGSNEGWGAYQVATSDTKPLLTFGRNYDGTGGIWFTLY